MDINIKAGELGFQEDHPIVFDDDEDELGAGPSSRRQVSVKKEVSLPAGATVSQIADEIAEAQVL